MTEEHEYVPNIFLNIEKEEIVTVKQSCFNCQENSLTKELPPEIYPSLRSKNNPLQCPRCQEKKKTPPYKPGDICPNCRDLFLNLTYTGD